MVGKRLDCGPVTSVTMVVHFLSELPLVGINQLLFSLYSRLL